MKRLTLEATDENILKSIKEDTYRRNSDVRDFIEALDTIEGNMFISLDARWGEGKTFYVRQIEKTLEYLTKKTWGDGQTETVEELTPYFQNTVLNTISLNQSYLPIYYNAWLYDNHDDPLMSLIYTIVKKSEQYLNTKLNTSVGEKIVALFSSVSISKKQLSVSADGEKIKNAIVGEDILKNVKTADEIHDVVKGILNETITEKAQRLVVFVDELDRCRPSYAIEMLERIKHYFDDERIIFVVSVNKEQLVHTISRYYGYGFDSAGYLNKFFDLNTYLPGLNSANNLFGSYRTDQHHLNKIAEGLNDYYKLSLRDGLIYKQIISMMPLDPVNDHTTDGCCLSLFVPLILILEIKDQNEKIKFLNGDSNLLEKISEEIEAIHYMICKFGGSGNDESEKFDIGFNKIRAVYDCVFKNKEEKTFYELGMDVSLNLKQTCIKLCNGFKL